MLIKLDDDCIILSQLINGALMSGFALNYA